MRVENGRLEKQHKRIKSDLRAKARRMPPTQDCLFMRSSMSTVVFVLCCALTPLSGPWADVYQPNLPKSGSVGHLCEWDVLLHGVVLQRRDYLREGKQHLNGSRFRSVDRFVESCESVGSKRIGGLVAGTALRRWRLVGLLCRRQRQQQQSQAVPSLVAKAPQGRVSRHLLGCPMVR
jgi:hypothetical protein